MNGISATKWSQAAIKTTAGSTPAKWENIGSSGMTQVRFEPPLESSWYFDAKTNQVLAQLPDKLGPDVTQYGTRKPDEVVWGSPHFHADLAEGVQAEAYLGPYTFDQNGIQPIYLHVSSPQDPTGRWYGFTAVGPFGFSEDRFTYVPPEPKPWLYDDRARKVIAALQAGVLPPGVTYNGYHEPPGFNGPGKPSFVSVAGDDSHSYIFTTRDDGDGMTSIELMVEPHGMRDSYFFTFRVKTALST